MQQETSTIKQTNAFAMQYGLFFGVVGILSLVTMGLSMAHPGFSFLSLLLTVGSPFLATYLTLRFRRQVMDPRFGFTLMRGSLFTFLMGIYAAIWVALFVLIYLSFLDGGRFFDAYEAMMTQPEVVAQMRQNGMIDQLAAQGMTMEDVINVMREAAPARYAGMILYFSLLVTLIFSLLIGCVARRAPQPFLSHPTDEDTPSQPTA